MKAVAIYLTMNHVLQLNIIEIKEDNSFNPLFRNTLQHSFTRIRRESTPVPELSLEINTPLREDRELYYSNYSIVLQPDNLSIFDVLGCIDAAIHSYQTWEKKRNASVPIIFVDSATVLARQDQLSLLYGVFNKTVAAHENTHNQLYRFIAEDFLQLYQSNAALAAYQQDAARLRTCLHSPKPLHDIFDIISPLPDMTLFLKKITTNELHLMLMNPVVPIVEKDKQLLFWLKSVIAEKQRAPSVIKDISSKIFGLFSKNEATITRKGTLKNNQDVSLRINTFFDDIVYLQKEMKKLWLSRAFADVADDDGYYAPHYTEVELLQDAKFFLNQDGLMEIEFRHLTRFSGLAKQHEQYQEINAWANKTSYVMYYLPPDKAATYDLKAGKNHALLEKELRALTSVLGLTILPDIDFHNDPIVFDAASTRRLIPYGFHYNQDFGKKLLGAAKCASVVLTAESPFLLFGRDLNAMIISQAMGVDAQDAHAAMQVAEVSVNQRPRV